MKEQISVEDFIDAYNINYNLGRVIELVVQSYNSLDCVGTLLKAQYYLGREIIRAGHEQEKVQQVLEGVRPAYHLQEDN